MTDSDKNIRIVPIVREGGQTAFDCPQCGNRIGFSPDPTTYSVTCPCGLELSLEGHCLLAGVEAM